MATPNRQLDSLLFLLPWELRHRIYEYYLTFTHDDFADSLRPMHTYLDAETPHTTPLPSLMLACKFTYRELAPLVHATAVLRVHLPGACNERRIGIAAHGTLQFDRLRRLVLIIDLDHAYYNAWLDFFGAVTARASKLEHLIVDWAPWPSPQTGSGWEARRDEKKERVFLDILKGLSTLQTIRFYGRIPERWTQMQDTAVTVNCSRERWWKEPGFNW